jgi:FdhD protein
MRKPTIPPCKTLIAGFHQDPEGEWVAELACGHAQHMRHRPPWQSRPWVADAGQRDAKLRTPIDCPLCTMPSAPEQVAEYRRTASFTEATIPAGLLREHRTKPGVWAKIVVETGALEYTLESPLRTFLLTAERAGMAPPAESHHITAVGPVRFHVEFLKEDLSRLPLWSPGTARALERVVDRRVLPGGAEKQGTGRDLVVAEEPLEIRLDGRSLMVTMRTPGDDVDLAAGLLFTEGVVSSLAQVASIEQGAEKAGRDRENIVSVTAAAGASVDVSAARRALRATAACGLCGKEDIAAVRRRLPRVENEDDTRVPLSVILGLPATVRAAQPVFDVTGGLHAVGLFRPDGTLLLVREDVGRHNAVDKVIGARLRGGATSLGGTVMLLSGRAGFELVQKAAVARVPILCSVSAPTALAIDLAEEVGMTLVGFVRGASANVYTHGWRIV